MPPKISTGLSLMELLITLAIISILSAIALPVYTQHYAHAKRIEAEVALMKLAAALEQFYLEKNTYQDATLATLHINPEIANGRYALAMTQADNTHYELQATPLASQAKADRACGTLTLNSLGEKNNSGKAKPEECW